MAKIVKYCGSCEEGFAEKFGFCPNCGSQLTAFEMNPLENKPAEEIKTAPANTVETFVSPVAHVEPEVPKIVEFPAIPAETETFAPIIEDAAPLSAVESTPAANCHYSVHAYDGVRCGNTPQACSQNHRSERTMTRNTWNADEIHRPKPPTFHSWHS